MTSFSFLQHSPSISYSSPSFLVLPKTVRSFALEVSEVNARPSRPASVSGFGTHHYEDPTVSPCTRKLTVLPFRNPPEKDRRIDSVKSMMAHAGAVKQPILNVTPLAREDLHHIKTDFRPPVTSFSGFRSRFSRSQSPAHLSKAGGTVERPKTSSGPALRRIEDFRGRDTKAKDDLTITSRPSAGTSGIVHNQNTTSFNFPLPSLQTPSKAREITITSRQSGTSSASPSPAPSLYRSRDTTPLGFGEHRAKLVDSRESSRSRLRKESAGSGYDQRLPLRELGKNTRIAPRTHMASTTSLQPQRLPIGMALGSPSQAPPNFQAMGPPSHPETIPAPGRSRASPPEHAHPLPHIPPQNTNPTTSTISADKPVKVSKWKLFFGKKSAQEVSKDIDKFAQGQTEEIEPIKLEVTKGKVGRSRTITEKKSTRTLKRDKERPGFSRATTAPTASDESYVKDIKAVPFSGIHSVDDVFANDQLNANNAQNERRPSNAANNGLLGVDIPSIQMERYSVMFSQLLESTKESPKKISSGNLLARRQATLDRLKTVNESIAELELEEARLGGKVQKPRRMTSPMASPSLSLYSGPIHLKPSAAAAARKPSRLQRSNTSPAMLSPGRMTFPSEKQLPPHPQSSYTAKDLVASPTSTVSDDAGPPTPDKHGQVVSVGVKKPEIKEPEWEMVDGATSTIKMRQRSNTTRQRADSAAQHSRPAAQRVRASTTTHHQPPISPRTSNSSSISNSNSTQSAASATSSQTTVSSSGHQQRPIPKIKIKHKPALEPYPSGIVPGVPGASMAALQNVSTSSVNNLKSESGTSTPQESQTQHPERGSSRQQPVPISHIHGQSQDAIMNVGMRIPVSRFSTAPARRLPPPSAEEEKPNDEEDEELQIRTAADVSIARQISISRQQSQMLRQRLARGERRRRGEAGKDSSEVERERRLNGRSKGEREIRHAIDNKGGLLQTQLRGVMPHMVSAEERQSSYGILEGE